MVAEEDEEDEDAWAAEDDYDELHNLGENEREAFLAEQERAEAALAAIAAQKTTLREARWKQKQIKLNRQFYPPKPFPRGKGSSSQMNKGIKSRTG